MPKGPPLQLQRLWEREGLTMVIIGYRRAERGSMPVGVTYAKALTVAKQYLASTKTIKRIEILAGRKLVAVLERGEDV
jgi:hypothetical protein